jgi:hypothetical protein
MNCIEIDSVTHHAYMTLVNFNSGEGQLVISLSFGQSGHVAIALTQAEVDGGMRSRMCRYGRIKSVDALSWIDMELATAFNWPSEARERVGTSLGMWLKKE